MGTMSS